MSNRLARGSPEPLAAKAKRLRRLRRHDDECTFPVAEALADEITLSPAANPAEVRVKFDLLCDEMRVERWLPGTRMHDLMLSIRADFKRLLPTTVALAAAQAMVAQADHSVWSYFSLTPLCC